MGMNSSSQRYPPLEGMQRGTDLTSAILLAQIGNPFVQFIKSFLVNREICVPEVGISYIIVSIAAYFADLLLINMDNGGVLYFQVKSRAGFKGICS